MRTYLAADLYRHGPAQTAQLHRQAAVWWAAQGRPVEALRHAALGDEPGLVTDLLHRWAPQLVARGEHAELRRALAAVETGAPGWTPGPRWCWHSCIW